MMTGWTKNVMAWATVIEQCPIDMNSRYILCLPSRWPIKTNWRTLNAAGHHVRSKIPLFISPHWNAGWSGPWSEKLSRIPVEWLISGDRELHYQIQLQQLNERIAWKSSRVCTLWKLNIEGRIFAVAAWWGKSVARGYGCGYKCG